MKEVTRIWWIMKDFQAGLEWAECLWARAILPIGLAHFEDDAPILPKTRQTSNYQDIEGETSTDGSGGPGTYPR